MRDTGFTAKAVVDNGYLWTAGYTRDMKAARLFNIWKAEPALRGTVVVPSALEGHETWKCCKVGGTDMGEYPDLVILVLSEGCTLDSFSFCDCPRLTTVVLPSSVKSVPYKCFSNCPKLKTIYSLAPDFDSASLQESAPDVKVVMVTPDKLPDELLAAMKTAMPSNGVETPPLKEKVLGRSGTIKKKAYKGKTDLEAVTIADGVTEIPEEAFACSSLKAVRFPASLVRIGRSAFQRTNLARVVIPGNVVEIDYGAFQNCERLTEVRLEDGLETVSYSAFAFCSSLSKVELPMSLQEIGGEAFWRCTSLEEIVIPSGVKRILRGAFSECAALKKVTLPKSAEVDDDVFAGTSAEIVRV